MNKVVRNCTVLLALLLVLRCASYPAFNPLMSEQYGMQYRVRGSLDGVVEYIQNTLRRFRKGTKAESLASNHVQVRTQLIYMKQEPGVRRVYRAYYMVSVVTIGDPEKKNQTVTVTCVVESRGKNENSWRQESPALGFDHRACRQEPFDALIAALEQMEREKK